MYLLLEDDLMAQSTLWYFMDERFRSQELYWEFFFPCPVFQLICCAGSQPVHGGICLQTKTAVHLQCRGALFHFPGLSGPLCQPCSFLLCIHDFLRETWMWERKRENFLFRWTQWWNKHKWLSRKTRDYKANSKLIFWVLKCRKWDTKPGKFKWSWCMGWDCKLSHQLSMFSLLRFVWKNSVQQYVF